VVASLIRYRPALRSSTEDLAGNKRSDSCGLWTRAAPAVRSWLITLGWFAAGDISSSYPAMLLGIVYPQRCAPSSAKGWVPG